MNSELSAPTYSHKATVRTSLSGLALLMNPRLNKGTAFTEAERDAFALHGLLPPHIGTLEDQRERRKRVLDRRPVAFGKYSNMRDLQDNDETLFYSLIAHYIEELLPIVYTPTVGEGCQRFSRDLAQAARPLPQLSQQGPHRADPRRLRAMTTCAASWSATASAFSAWAIRAQAAWAFPSAKWRSTPRWAAFRPSTACPFCSTWAPTTKRCSTTRSTSAGSTSASAARSTTSSSRRLSPPSQRRWPHILLQWEDFAGVNAASLLERYRNRLCTFNDDIQGTAAVTTGTLLAAVRATGIPLKEQTIAMFGSGSAGIGIGDLLIAAMQEEGLSEAAGPPAHLLPSIATACSSRAARAFAPARSRCCASARTSQDGSCRPPLRHRAQSRCSMWCATPASPCWSASRAQPGAFTEEIVREMARHTPAPDRSFRSPIPPRRPKPRPPTCCAGPMAARWSAPAVPSRRSRSTASSIRISQVNNSFIFPGLALGILVSRARPRDRRHDHGRGQGAGPPVARARGPGTPRCCRPSPTAARSAWWLPKPSASKPSPTALPKSAPHTTSRNICTPMCGSRSTGPMCGSIVPGKTSTGASVPETGIRGAGRNLWLLNRRRAA